MRYDLHHGDCLEVMPTLPADSIDTIITDPPYGLSFMGKDWDHGIPGARFWREALRVAKPGAMLLAFGGTRTHHRLMVAIEDAGWEIRDVIMWVYGSGFPKSHDISKAINAHEKTGGSSLEMKRRAALGDDYSPSGTYAPGERRATQGITTAYQYDIQDPTPAAREWHGYGTALKPAYEPIIVAMKPLDGTFANNALTHGVAGLWIDGARVGTEGGTQKGNPPKLESNGVYGNGINGACDIVDIGKGRWPANLIHDGSDEVLAGMADAARFFYCAKASRAERNAGLEGLPEREIGRGTSRKCANCNQPIVGLAQTGKCKCSDRSEQHTKYQNHHPTVKPLALMRYLARITRPPSGGVVLDPFMGSGSTGMAAVMEGRDFVGIELDADYMEIAQRRIAWAEAEAEREGGRQLGLFRNGSAPT